MPEGPRCLRWWIVRPSGPAARELPLFRKALETMSVVKGVREVSSGCSLLRRRLTPRARGSDEWGEIEVNCLLKAEAIARLLVRVLLLNLIGWLGGGVVRLPERSLRRLKNWEALCLCEHDSTVWIHVDSWGMV